MDDQLDLIDSVDWDVLLVFDACRWDYFEEEFGGGRPVRTPASCTKDWLGELKSLDWSSVTCVTANPIHRYQDAERWFSRFDDVGKRSWEEINGIPTVHPDSVTDAVQMQLTLSDGPVYGHYVQPHAPYPKAGLNIKQSRPEPDSSDRIRDVGGAVDDGETSWSEIRAAYRENLRWVYESAEPLIEDDSLTTAVTSDHGELLGEGDRFGHLCYWQDEKLSTVPWNVT